MRIQVAASLSLLVLAASACSGGGSASSPAGDDTSGTPTPVSSATPGPTPANATCRSIQIANGADGTGAMNDVYFASALSGQDVSEFLGAGGWNTNAPITLCAAPPVGNRSAVTLAADVTVAISLPQSNCLCRSYLAAGSTGTLYGGADTDKIDVTVSLNSNAASAGGAPTMADGTTSVRQAGDLKVMLMAKDAQISAGASACTASACSGATSGAAAHGLWYTTGTAISQVTNSKQGGTVSVTVSGTPFGSDFSDLSSKGALAGAAEQSEDNASAGGDVATVERIAEH